MLGPGTYTSEYQMTLTLHVILDIGPVKYPSISMLQLDTNQAMATKFDT